MHTRIGLVICVFLSGCMSTDFSKSVPAVLADDGRDYRPAITKIVSEVLGGRRVTLTRDAFMKDSRLLLEPKTEPLDPFGNPLSGRLLGKPDNFSLVTSGDSCAILHEDTGEYYILEGVACRPL